mgnify:CR=1 FL=1
MAIVFALLLAHLARRIAFVPGFLLASLLGRQFGFLLLSGGLLPDGLGFRILEAREFMWSDKIIAGMITIGLLGLFIDTAVSRLNNHLLRWHRGLEH